ncbi:MAG: Ig-like domain-containing protein [Acholeplasmataceae bacterium]|nr:Ig-like domain-containing protein [Acholeplasmataceae bacterium]
MKKFLIILSIIGLLFSIIVYYTTNNIAYHQRLSTIYNEKAAHAYETGDFSNFVALQAIYYQHLKTVETDDYRLIAYQVIGRENKKEMNQVGLFVVPKTDVPFATTPNDNEDQTAMKVYQFTGTAEPLKNGDIYQIESNVIGIFYASSDETILTVSETGEVQALKKGEATVQLIHPDSLLVIDEITFQVFDPLYDSNLDPNYQSISYGIAMLNFYFYAIRFDESVIFHFVLFDYDGKLIDQLDLVLTYEEDLNEITSTFQPGSTEEELNIMINAHDTIMPKIVRNMTIYALAILLVGFAGSWVIKKRQR